MIPSSGFPLLPVGSNINDSAGSYSNIRNKAQEYWDYFLYGAGFFVQYDPSINDYFDIIQEALNTWQKVIIGFSDSEVFTISQPLRPNNGNILEINGRLKIYDGHTSLVVADVERGDNSFRVADPSLFKVGQFAGVNDDSWPPGPSYSRRAWVGEILSIVDDVITLDNVSAYDWQLSLNATAAHCQSNILVYEKENVLIYGRGIIDNNGDGQYEIRPVYGLGPAENQNAACGISVFRSKNIKIKDLTFVDGRMHNLAVHDFVLAFGCDTIYIEGVRCYDASEKNIIIRLTKNVWINNVHCEGAKLEDGLMFYSAVENAFVNNYKGINNRRYGLGWSSGLNRNLNASNIYTERNYRYGIYLRSPRWCLTNVISKDPSWITSTEKLYDGIISNWQFVDVDVNNHANSEVLTLRGDIEDVLINGLLVKGCNGTAIKTTELSGKVPIRTKISNWSIINHTGTEIDLTDGGDVTFLNPEHS